MTRLSLAILGTAAILTSALAGPAMAKSTMATGAKDKQVCPTPKDRATCNAARPIVANGFATQTLS